MAQPSETRLDFTRADLLALRADHLPFAQPKIELPELRAPRKPAAGAMQTRERSRATLPPRAHKGQQGEEQRNGFDEAKAKEGETMRRYLLRV